MKSLEIVRRARIAGYDGGKSALYSVIASLRPRRSRPLGHQDKVPGEVVRHGLGQVDVRFADGQSKTVGLLVSRLEYSRYAAVSLVSDQGVETLVRTQVSHYQAMGGVSLLAAFDRAKPIALRTDAEGQVVEWDPSFAYAAVQLGLGVEVRARRGADRGLGTNLANWVKSGFFKDRVFASEADLERQLADWVAKNNNTVSVENGGEVRNQVPAVLLTEERQRLRPLKIKPETLSLRVPVVVGPRATVVHEGQSYAMPPESVGLVGALHLFPDRVVVVAGRYQTTHPRFGSFRLEANPWQGLDSSRPRPARSTGRSANPPAAEPSEPGLRAGAATP